MRILDLHFLNTGDWVKEIPRSYVDEKVGKRVDRLDFSEKSFVRLSMIRFAIPVEREEERACFQGRDAINMILRLLS